MTQHDTGATVRAETLPGMLARAASVALRAEIDLTPKPGLVDRRDTGAHRDMDHGLMHASVDALEIGFHDMAAAGIEQRDPYTLRAELGLLGRESEARMMLATNGVNTHRGAIWGLGLIVAVAAQRPRWRAPVLLQGVAAMAAIDDPAVSPLRCSNGQRAVQRYHVAGARGEACRGFPALAEAGLPMLRRARARGCSERVARLNALLAIMAVLDDTCVLSRAGRAGLVQVQANAAAILDMGGVGTVAGGRALACFERELLGLNASPGGSADLLAATLLIDALEYAAQRPWGRVRCGDTRLKEKGHATLIA
ncbi:triphosphoribosyl-dephospho-CoA synthase [Salinisphaera sp. T5B8]|uniref:triphosphoribosyl-dephospho-CoA synthase n=1 Tax=Salinisphaera sp. T5B8 TaxID=1304154 RepID=UPI00334039FB